MKHTFSIFHFPLSIVLIALVCLTGCRPKGILSSREMRDIMYDLHRVDGMMDVMQLGNGYDEDLARYYQSVLDRHGVTQAQFDSSLVWYTDNPALFDKIYPKVMDRLDEDVACWEAALAREQKRRALLSEPYTQMMPCEMQVVAQMMLDSISECPGPVKIPEKYTWWREMHLKMQKKY